MNTKIKDTFLSLIAIFFLFQIGITSALALTEQDIYEIYESADSPVVETSGLRDHCLVDGNFDACKSIVDGSLDKKAYDRCLEKNSESYCAGKKSVGSKALYIEKMYEIATNPHDASKLIEYIMVVGGKNLTDQRGRDILNFIDEENGKQANFAKFIIYKNTNIDSPTDITNYLELAASKIGQGNQEYDKKILSYYDYRYQFNDFKDYANILNAVNSCGNQCEKDKYYIKLLDKVESHDDIKKFYTLLMECVDCSKNDLLLQLTKNTNFNKSFTEEQFTSSIEYEVLKQIGYSASMNKREDEISFDLDYTNGNRGRSLSVKVRPNCAEKGDEYTRREDTGLFDMFPGDIVALEKIVTYQRYSCESKQPKFITFANNKNDFLNQYSNSGLMRWEYIDLLHQKPVLSSSSRVIASSPTSSNDKKITAPKGQYSIEKTYTGGFSEFGLEKKRKVWVLKCTHDGSSTKISTTEKGDKWYILDDWSGNVYSSFEKAAERSCD